MVNILLILQELHNKIVSRDLNTVFLKALQNEYISMPRKDHTPF